MIKFSVKPATQSTAPSFRQTFKYRGFSVEEFQAFSRRCRSSSLEDERKICCETGSVTSDKTTTCDRRLGVSLVFERKPYLALLLFIQNVFFFAIIFSFKKMIENEKKTKVKEMFIAKVQ